MLEEVDPEEFDVEAEARVTLAPKNEDNSSVRSVSESVDLDNLVRRFSIESKPKGSGYVCILCCMAVTTKRAFQYHYAARHGAVDSVCKRCNLVCGGKKALEKHAAKCRQ